ncbi:MAG: hypothetical protein ACREMS_07455 [Gemmatimonadaceae bacterium]
MLIELLTRAVINPFRGLAVSTLLAGSIALFACSGIVDAPIPTGAQLFSPPPVYTTWWNLTQSCSGISGSLASISWYDSGASLENPQTGEGLAGYWDRAGNDIVLTHASTVDGPTVRHEMLHALLRQPGHPRTQFLGKCAGVVDCEGQCVVDGGPITTPAGAIRVPSDSIDVSLEVAPINPTSANDGGFFSLTVKARNHGTHFLVITNDSPAAGPTDTFSFDVEGPAQLQEGEVESDSSQITFAPGEEKLQVFDFRIGDSPFLRQLQAGTYTISGAYAHHSTVPISVVIGP